MPFHARCGNIKITQRALNHSRIDSTLPYINVRDDKELICLQLGGP